MEEQKIDLNEIVVIEQLPKIRETLGVISENIDKEIQKALDLDCTEESKVEVKKARANLTKIKTALEERRKQVKEQVMKPYDDFENIYNELVKDKLTNADKILKERIDVIELTQREEKIKELLGFANEYIRFYGLEGIIEAKQVIPNVTLSKSQKSLKEQIKGELERIANEIAVIKEEENSKEILVKYLENGFDYPKAKLETINQHKKMEQLDTSLFTETVVENYENVVPEEEITTPKEIVEEDTIDLIECEFRVLATKEQLIQIKNYLQELGVKYE